MRNVIQTDPESSVPVDMPPEILNKNRRVFAKNGKETVGDSCVFRLFKDFRLLEMCYLDATGTRVVVSGIRFNQVW